MTKLHATDGEVSICPWSPTGTVVSMRQSAVESHSCSRQVPLKSCQREHSRGPNSSFFARGSPKTRSQRRSNPADMSHNLIDLGPPCARRIDKSAQGLPTPHTIPRLQLECLLNLLNSYAHMHVCTRSQPEENIASPATRCGRLPSQMRQMKIRKPLNNKDRLAASFRFHRQHPTHPHEVAGGYSLLRRCLDD